MSESLCFRKFIKKIPAFLSIRPLTTQEIYDLIRQAFPECISEERCHHGKEGKLRRDYEWQHSIRRAQYYLKGKKKINLIGSKWYKIEIKNLSDEIEETEVESLFQAPNLDKIRQELKSISPKSSKYETINGIRFQRDSVTVAKLKILRQHRCQICGMKILKKDGSFYTEGAHINPKRYGSSETPDNILILCPNHHKEFDLGKREILEKNQDFIRFILNDREYNINLTL